MMNLSGTGNYSYILNLIDWKGNLKYRLYKGDKQPTPRTLEEALADIDPSDKSKVRPRQVPTGPDQDPDKEGEVSDGRGHLLSWCRK